MRLIDADALKEEVNHNYLVMKNTRVIEIGWLNEYVIDCMPTVEPERPQGHWILEQEDVDSGGNNRYQCSVCGYMDIHTDCIDIPYCWHCGSKLETEVSNNDE